MHKLLPALLGILLILSICVTSKDVYAEPPTGFTLPRSTFSLGIEAFDAMLGEFGSASDVGMGVFAEATLQIKGYFGASVRFGSSRAFTKKEFLPFDNGYQFIYFAAAPRFNFAPFRKLNLYLFVQPEIELQVLISNTLVSLTGNENTSGAAGGSVGIQFIVGIISITGMVTCLYNWNFESLFVGGGLSVGLTNIIP